MLSVMLGYFRSPLCNEKKCGEALTEDGAWQELLAAREAYELGCLLSVANEDIPG